MLWDEELLPGMDRGNPFAENREYTKTLVFGDYRMTTAAPVWYLRRAVEDRQRARIERPTRPRTLSPDQLAVLQAYYQSCFARLPEEVGRFVNRLLGGYQPLIEAVTGLHGEPARCYYAAQGRLKNVLEEYAFMLRGRQIGEVFDTLAGCRGVRIKMFGKDPENAAQLRGEGEGAIRLPPCGWAERFTEDDTDTNAHNKSHGQALQQRFNSPFWPVVLAASSVAQEGLDFHWYSHAIAHWSLPKNPVEYMQREGRIDRYLSHLVRKRMHLLFPDAASFAALENACLHPRTESMEHYRLKRPLYPYWYIGQRDFQNLTGQPSAVPLPNFQRLVCALPLSSEAIFWDKLQKALANYNLHLGPGYQSDTVTARNFCPLLRG